MLSSAEVGSVGLLEDRVGEVERSSGGGPEGSGVPSGVFPLSGVFPVEGGSKRRRI